VPEVVVRLRILLEKNFFCLLMLSNGIPMFTEGDEFLQTQGGNNNPYNLDNEITWLNWNRLQQNTDIFRFFKLMIAFRKAHPTICRSRFWRQDVRWRGVEATTDLSYHSQSLAYYLNGKSQNDADLYVMINAFTEPLTFPIFDGQQRPWSRIVDTSFDSPNDICAPGSEVPIRGSKYVVQPRSIVVLTQ
jgi:isoamylase